MCEPFRSLTSGFGRNISFLWGHDKPAQWQPSKGTGVPQCLQRQPTPELVRRERDVATSHFFKKFPLNCCGRVLFSQMTSVNFIWHWVDILEIKPFAKKTHKTPPHIVLSPYICIEKHWRIWSGCNWYSSAFLSSASSDHLMQFSVDVPMAILSSI